MATAENEGQLVVRFRLEIRRRSAPAATRGLRKWRSRSGKSASETDALPEGLQASRVASFSGPKPRYEPPKQDLPPIQQVRTPYLSESDHVFSLQHPTMASVSPGTVAMTPSKSQQSSESIVVSPGPKNGRPMGFSEEPLPDSRAQTSLKPAAPLSPLVSPRILYLKAKKEIESKLKHQHPDDSYLDHPTDADLQTGSALGTERSSKKQSADEDSRTRSTIEGARRFLAAQSISRTGTWFKDEHHTLKIGRKLFGKAPWHRKESNDSINSVSSSVRAVLKGQTPPASPANQWLRYTNSYNTSNTTFPGGEAVRVSTPPLDEDTADGRPRGFFTSLTPPLADGETSTKATPPVRSTKRYSVHGQPRQWWDQMPQRTGRRDHSGATGNKFEFDVLEHLPGSPLCPADKRHKSGGTGVCVYHGRRKTGSHLREELSRGEGDYSSSDLG
ncbi:hypothetical protein A9Z42_0012690 [Trichoderma parareesei]|uniref:Uncharacterized protein n=1 Tax=Trichoderma parareesei TaxID=858221 RepID=A0A2H2ZJR7_TRIPA|nr:hypothetical protein A9Z42_0012690 [Trichoderma parareesei]